MAAPMISDRTLKKTPSGRIGSQSSWLRRWLGHEGMYGEERLCPLLSYRYQGIDKSFISRYILSHYWNWAVTLFPTWMAPNLITLLGFSFMILALMTGLYFIPDLIGPGPAWIYFFFAACIWIYSTCDNVDGKQARRTNSSSPLGELFDHGCDALNCFIGGLVQIMAMGLGSTSLWSVIVLLFTFWAFYLPTWEEYHTGVLYLGYVNGPTEGLLSVMATMIISGIYGPAIWRRTLGESFPTYCRGTMLEEIELKQGLVGLFLFSFLLFHVPTCIYTVYKACCRNRRSFRIALGQLLPMALATVAALSWTYHPHSQIRSHHFVLFWTSFGIGFGKMATKIIYSHLTKRKFPTHSGLMIPLFMGSVLINLPCLGLPQLLTGELETLFLWGWLIVAIFGYFNWSYHLIKSFCGYLGIKCFSLTKLRQKNVTRIVSKKVK